MKTSDELRIGVAKALGWNVELNEFGLKRIMPEGFYYGSIGRKPTIFSRWMNAEIPII
jgi:hypothetical protein